MTSQVSTPAVEFWYEFASTYSYLAIMRAEALAGTAGVDLRWRPFLLGPIFAAQGWATSPFNIFEAKGRYMWRDLERLCAREGLPFRRPSTMPRNGLHAARVALVAEPEGWCPTFSRAVFHANFAEDRDIGRTEVLAEILTDLGRPAPEILARAASPDIKERLRGQTEDAMRAGIFGAPSFRVGGELFWGNDRLEQALEWARAPWLPIQP